MHNNSMLRDIKRLLGNQHFWKFLAALSCFGFLAAGGYSGYSAANHKPEPFPATLVFGGNPTKQVFFCLGLIFMCAFIVPVAAKFSNAFRPVLWGFLLVGMEVWNWNENTGKHHAGRGHLPVQHILDISHSPVAAIALGVIVKFMLAMYGSLKVADAAPERDPHFGHPTKETWLSRMLGGVRKGKKDSE
jgi:hypothetical protein